MQGDVAGIGDLDPITGTLQQIPKHTEVLRQVIDDQDHLAVGAAATWRRGRMNHRAPGRMGNTALAMRRDRAII